MVKIKTTVTKEERKSILKAINSLEKPVYIEIGVHKGGNLQKIKKYCEEKKINCKLIGIDLFEDFKESEDNTHHLKNDSLKVVSEKLGGKVELLKGDSSTVLKKISELNDCVIFIDGNHAYEGCLKDYEQAKRIVKNGFIIFHNSTNDKVPDEEYFEKDGGPYKVIVDEGLVVERFGRSAVLKVK